MCRSQKLLLYTGLLHGGFPGVFTYSPTLVRSVEKTIALVDDAMRRIGAEKVVMPSLGDGKLWKKSNRWKDMGHEMFRLKDRQNYDICLAPTHEEEVTNYVASAGVIGHTHLPIRLYQITTKFRDEGQPRFGLLRSREFLMKDLYTFDDNRETARETYNAVCHTYQDLLHHLRVPFVKVEAMAGLMGGNFSHEFHIPADIGEDELAMCSSCGQGQNIELLDNPKDAVCPHCVGSMGSVALHREHAIEVAHCFLLGNKYSKSFGAVSESRNNLKSPLEMGCFGIGITRLITAALEVLSTEEELRWPKSICPFHAAIITQKSGGKGALSDADMASLIQTTSEVCPKNDLLVDDRPNFSIGRKLVELRRFGIPYILVAKQQEFADHFEFVDVYNNTSGVLPLHEIANTLSQRYT